MEPDPPETGDLDLDAALLILERLAGAVQPPSAPLPAYSEAAISLPSRQETLPTLPAECFRDLLETLPDAVVLINQAGTILFVNQQTEVLFGYHRGELLGQAIEVLVPEPLGDSHVEHRRRYFAAPRARTMREEALRLAGRRKDGSEVPVEISLSPLATPAGLLVTGIIRDLTARDREEAKFRTLVENIPAVTFFAPLDQSRPQLYVSPQIEQLLGFSQKEWLEDPVLWYRQLHPEDRERWNRHFAPTCSSGDPFRSVYRFLAKDGRIVWVHGSANVVRDRDGTPLFLQGVAFDVTSIKEAELELERANRAKDRFLASMSHELRTPLNAILGFTGTLLLKLPGPLNPDQEEQLQTVENSANHLLSLINDLLDLAKIESGKVELTLAPVDLAEVIQEVAATLTPLALARGLRLETRVPEPGLVSRTNRRAVTQVLLNLTGNAIKFTDAGRVRLELEQALEAGQAVTRIHVSDTGIGIRPEDRARVFQAFEQVFGSPRQRGQGTGLGLHLSQKLAGLLGGQIRLQSEPGQGSTFTLMLPSR